MTPQDVQKLLGGYATGTLTDAEQQALFTAALEDQQLFDTLAREQALRDLLRDPAAKAQLLAALEARPARRWSWWPGAVAAAMAGVAALAVLVVRMNTHSPAAVEMAEVRPIAPPAPAPVGPLGVMPLPGAQPAARKPFVLPPRKTAPTPQLPEPPRVDMPKQVEVGNLRGVIGGVPAAPAPPPSAVSLADKVEVTAAAPAVNMFRAAESGSGTATPVTGRPTARMLFFGNQTRDIALARARVVGGVTGQQPANAGVRYSILRKEPGGNFAEIDPAELKTGDTVELRITTNTSGYLSVGGAAPVAVSAMTPHTTAPLPAGQQEVRIVFTRQQQAPPVAVQTVSEVENHSTYVANPASGQSVSFTIKLQYK